MGVIYILTNPSFKEYIKIGYTENINQRLRNLNRSECIPFSFRLYATFPVPKKIADKNIHKLIDSINPGLRSIENFNNKKRVREFFAISPEKAYDSLIQIVDMFGWKDKAKIYPQTKDEINDIKKSNEIEEQNFNNKRILKFGKDYYHKKRERFNFVKSRIPIGSTINFIKDKNITCTVASERTVRYDGKEWYLSPLTQYLLNDNRDIRGTIYFEYKGKTLDWYWFEYQICNK